MYTHTHVRVCERVCVQHVCARGHDRAFDKDNFGMGGGGKEGGLENQLFHSTTPYLQSIIPYKEAIISYKGATIPYIPHATEAACGFWEWETQKDTTSREPYKC